MVDGVQRRGFVINPATGHSLPAAGGAVLASAADTGGLFSLIYSRAPTGDQVPRHVHHGMDEAFFVLDGEYAIECGQDTLRAGPNSFVFLPRGTPHAYAVVSPGAVKLILAVPGGIEGFFEDMAAGVSPDELTHRHGITFL